MLGLCSNFRINWSFQAIKIKALKIKAFNWSDGSVSERPLIWAWEPEFRSARPCTRVEYRQSYTYNPDELNQWAPGSLRDRISKAKVENDWEIFSTLTFWPANMYIHSHERVHISHRNYLNKICLILIRMYFSSPHYHLSLLRSCYCCWVSAITKNVAEPKSFTKEAPAKSGL